MSKCIFCHKDFDGRPTEIICPECVKHIEVTKKEGKDPSLYMTSLDQFGEALSDSQKKIVEICDATKDLLLYKNSKYGDSALHPNNVFYKGDSVNSILIRLDDKIGRVKSNPDSKPRINDISDIIGYCTLLLISMGATKDDIAKFKD